MSNFPLGYKLSWLPRLLKPSLGGDRQGLLPPRGTLLPSPPAQTRRLVFVGDISAVANREAPEIDERLRALMASADLVIGNCESPVVQRPHHPRGTAAGTRHAMTRQFLAETLEAAGIVPQRLLLSLANNHMLDQGIEGYAETRSALATLGIATIGGAEDRLVRTVDLGGPTISFTAFTEWRNAGPQDFATRVTMLGDLIEGDFAALRYSEADLVCVVAHWDREFRHLPRPATRALAARLAEDGADLIVGHHAHVLQPAQRIGETFVAYGLGDFLGTVLPRVPWPLRLGGILAAKVSADPNTRGRLAEYSVIPIVRSRAGRRERLAPLHGLSGSIGVRLSERFAAIFPRAA